MKKKLKNFLKPFLNWRRQRLKLKIEKNILEFTNQLDKLLDELDRFFDYIIEQENQINVFLGETADLISKLKTAIISQQDEVGVMILSEILNTRQKLLDFSQRIQKAEEQLDYIVKFSEQKVGDINKKINLKKHLLTNNEIREIDMYLEKILQKIKSQESNQEKKHNIEKLKLDIVNSINYIPNNLVDLKSIHDIYNGVKKHLISKNE